ncbi:MAG: acetyl-CoA hydrolase/transferase family protein [Fibrobacterota bacterium]|nr:acetyl-CoA hydrolase/transferase family protein [Fibrobacterota bacterium]QQS04390.1 MAG: acetyl-CoA hydrolase/transferase family protein [Fibrobacterota bacterium]
MSFAKLDPKEAAALIQHDMNVGFSGFTPAGSPKVVSLSLAEQAKAEHDAGRPFKIGVITGASTGDSLDGALARADAIKFRTPYQSNNDLRKALNDGRAEFFDMHLSQLQQTLRSGALGKIDVAVVEAADVTDDGEILLTSGVGSIPTTARMADKVIIEVNTAHSKDLHGIHDIFEPNDPPFRQPIPITSPRDRIGTPRLKIDPKKIVGIVENNQPDDVKGFDELTDVTRQIGANAAAFLAGELRAGRIPSQFLPIQSGVGNIANAVMAALNDAKDIPAFEMYTEVIQDAVFDLIDSGKVKFASGCSFTISPPIQKRLYDDLKRYRQHLILRPQEISNNPEIVRRLGLITMNTALEADIFGNINSTHVLGRSMMNGIGGSGDFTRNAYLSIFACPSTAKGGKISAIVPLCSHIDHSEHSVGVIITECGVADLRGKGPLQRANAVIDNCVHPSYRDQLRDYLKLTGGAHTPHTLSKAFRMHVKFEETGTMQGVDWA